MKMYAVRFPDEPKRLVIMFARDLDDLSDVIDSEEDPSLAEYAVLKQGIAFEVHDHEDGSTVNLYGASANGDPFDIEGLRWKRIHQGAVDPVVEPVVESAQ